MTIQTYQQAHYVLSLLEVNKKALELCRQKGSTDLLSSIVDCYKGDIHGAFEAIELKEKIAVLIEQRVNELQKRFDDIKTNTDGESKI